MSRGMGLFMDGTKEGRDRDGIHSSRFFSSSHHDDGAHCQYFLPCQECPQQALPTRPVAAADGNGYSWSEDLVYNDERIFSRGPSDIKDLEDIGVNWAVLYSSSILATLLWCTIFMVYRILRVGGIAAGMRVCHRLIEMLVESASLYSAVIVTLPVSKVRSDAAEIYIKELAIATRGIVPTILVGRIAAGHARPDDSWSENTTTSSLQFRSSLTSQSDSVDMSRSSESDLSPRITLDLENGLEDSAESASED
ncbi:hypothetical protein ARMGADRAFT_1111900 [Armillaria gallica]|uniref:Uncharacterized protein n=1 Tax=Armillaria gallica TaxID=47427 RepID=A0A2H3DQK3_ARMGA|nr:hypothetical protein ARMGADRAFT_1111900 [Armillaria gallica]